MTMVCANITGLIGVTCHPLSDDGSVAMLDTSFRFADGDAIPVFVEKIPGKVRFFDDGGVLRHFLGRGIKIESNRNTVFLKTAGEAHGVKLTQEGEFEIWSSDREAPDAFAKYMSALVAVTDWERSQEGVASDMSLFVMEVEQCLRALDPFRSLREKPQYVGISGQVYKLDFDFDGKAVIAITPHRASVSSAIRKLIDIRSRAENVGFDAMIVIDDRRDPDAANSESQVLGAVSKVWPMSRLEQKAGLQSV